MPRTLPAEVQQRLARTYGIDGAPLVDDFIRPADGPAREALFIREERGELEMALQLPREALAVASSFDAVCQLVEGVSHFLYVAERARRELPVTQLELELQAEVDKYLLLAHGGIEEEEAPGSPWWPRAAPARQRGRFDPERAAWIHACLFERVSYMHPANTEAGERYRVANDLAARFVRRLEVELSRGKHPLQLIAALRRFYAAGQAEKIALALAA